MTLPEFQQGEILGATKLNAMVAAINALQAISGDGLIQFFVTDGSVTARLNLDGLRQLLGKFPSVGDVDTLGEGWTGQETFVDATDGWDREKDFAFDITRSARIVKHLHPDITKSDGEYEERSAIADSEKWYGIVKGIDESGDDVALQSDQPASGNGIIVVHEWYDRRDERFHSEAQQTDDAGSPLVKYLNLGNPTAAITTQTGIAKAVDQWIEVTGDGTFTLSSEDWRGRSIWASLTVYDGIESDGRLNDWVGAGGTPPGLIAAGMQGDNNTANGDATCVVMGAPGGATVTVSCEDNTGHLLLTAASFTSTFQCRATVTATASKTGKDGTIA